MNGSLAAHFALVSKRPMMFLPEHTLSAASAYVTGAMHNQIDLLRAFNQWFGEKHHGRPELAFWGGITGELIGDTTHHALSVLTDDENITAVERLFALLDDFLTRP